MFETRAEQFFKVRAVDVAAQHVQPTKWIGKPDSVQAIQSSHRLDVLYAWLVGADPTTSLLPNSDAHDVEADYTLLAGNVMDLGCGQGDQTGALAAVIAAHEDKFTGRDRKPARILGVDPAPPDYGAPYTIKQAQDGLLEKALRPISFVLGKTGPEVLQEQKVDTVLLSHSLWYFMSVQVLKETFKAIREAGAEHLLLAEWALTASQPHALPHLLAALLQGQSPVRGGNVQTPLSPEQIKKVAGAAGWKVTREVTFVPTEKLQDGGWEVDMARNAADEAVKAATQGDSTTERLVQSVQATRYALEEAVKRNGNQTGSMDIWTAVLTPA